MKFLEDLLRPLESLTDKLFQDGWIGWLGVGALSIILLYILYNILVG
jgi:hypothetical protein